MIPPVGILIGAVLLAPVNVITVMGALLLVPGTWVGVGVVDPPDPGGVVVVVVVQLLPSPVGVQEVSLKKSILSSPTEGFLPATTTVCVPAERVAFILLLVVPL